MDFITTLPKKVYSIYHWYNCIKILNIDNNIHYIKNNVYDANCDILAIVMKGIRLVRQELEKSKRSYKN